MNRSRKLLPRGLLALIGLACLLPRPPAMAENDSEAELRFWLRNMIWSHGYTRAEAAAGLDIDEERVDRLLVEYGITRENAPARNQEGPIEVLPWAPGRHPRLGFLEGAIDPQRDTKLSIFLPWESAGYVVFDLPEAVFSNLGLTYLAHTHVPTIWTERGIELERIDWRRLADGSLETSRTLPNGVSFGARVVPRARSVDFEYWLHNGTEQVLTGLRNQLCLMLGHAPGFNEQTGGNKLLLEDAAAVRSEDGMRWIVVATERSRSWQNPPVPCIHADPTFPDCPPLSKVSVRGSIFFFEGEDAAAEIERRRRGGILFGGG